MTRRMRTPRTEAMIGAPASIGLTVVGLPVNVIKDYEHVCDLIDAPSVVSPPAQRFSVEELSFEGSNSHRACKENVG